MGKNIILISTLIILNSCATIINSPFQRVLIDHDPGISLRVDTSKFFYRTSEIYNVYIPRDYFKKSYYFLRSGTAIPIIINETDTLNIKPHRSYFAYWFANIYTTWGLGMLIDNGSDKSFEYPFYNYYSYINGVIKNIRFKPIPENKIKFTLEVPFVNLFQIRTDSGKIGSASGLGISAGLEYFMKNSIYLSLNAGVTLDVYSSRTDTVNSLHYFHDFAFGFNECSSAKYLSFRINKISPRLEYGAGITLTSLKWRSNDITDLTDSTYFYTPAHFKSLNLGLSTEVRIRLTPNFSIGILYHPLFYDLDHNNYNYQHIISTELVWRF